MNRIIATLGMVASIAYLAPAALGQASTLPPDKGPDSKVYYIDDRPNTSPVEIVAPTAPPEPQRLNAPTPERPAEAEHRRPQPGPGDWISAQLFFIIWGLIATMIALVICPRASLMTVATIENEPMRCAAVGTVGLLAIGLFNVLNTVLFGAALWAPFGMLFFFLSMVIFVYSAILGIVFIGSGVARRFGWHGLGFFGRAAAGFAALAILNCLPLASMASMGLQCVAVLCGLGGLIVTGFGSDPQWLTRILSGNRPK